MAERDFPEKQPVVDDFDRSIGDEATLAGKAKRRPASEVSLGDERTLGDNRSGNDTVTDDIEVVDLEARYRVEGTLGQGGMGAVLLATDTRLDRKVAIKRILGEAAGNRMAVQRFLTEAKAIAALNHPNIVQIYDYGRAKDGPFLIMEYVDGGSLLDKCRESALPIDEAIDLACQLCDGLAKAHDLGIIHRDIKPANVLLTNDGIPKLTDFGLAKASASDHGQTMTGAVLGTPDFMPPEQRRDASEVDARSDLWSLAATVYQMVTGRSPKIIRFKDVPESIQEVLGKALEDRKDERYQTARELRNALKTSLLVRAPAAAVPDVLEGKCPACGVQNDSSRKFCRGCGESLEAPCLSCDKPMPMWEQICGSCGGKQAPLVDERRRAMAARQAEAEGLLGDFEFDRAVGIATQLRDEAHPRLKHLAGWGASFLEQIEKSRTEQTRHAVDTMAEAGKHVAEYDYSSAIVALEGVPDSLRAGVLPGMREPAGAMLDRVKKTQGEASRLEARIKERLAAKQLDELLPDVENLLNLRPDREDLQKIRVQLLERQQKQVAARVKALEVARASLASHEYDAAFAAVSGVAAAMVTPEVVAVREQAESFVRRVRKLAGKIKEAVTAKQFDGLLDVVEEYLKLKPDDVETGKLRQTLVEREEKIGAEITARLEQAEQLEQACRFDEAKKLLTAIPEPRRTKRVSACLDRASRLGPMRQAALESLANAKSGAYAAAVESSRLYGAAIADTGITDGEFAALLSKAEAARAQEERTRKILKLTSVAGAAVAAVVLIVVAGLWMRSSARAAALNTALRKGNWNDALQLDPENVAALVGRAREKLRVTPADIEGAFADLDRAESVGGPTPAGTAVRGDGHALRAQQQARTDRLDEAGKELAEAKRFAGTAELFATAREALVAGWLGRAQEASKKRDGKRLQQALSSAKAAGAIDQRLLAVWEQYARAHIQSLDAKGLELACVEGGKLGLSQTQKALWWLEFGGLGVEQKDEAAVRAGADGWQALGLQPDADKSSAGLWKLQAEACLKRFDAKGLATACTEGGKNGLPPTDIAELWIRFAESAAKPPHEDPAAVQTAVVAAKAAGASDQVVRPLQASGLMLQAITLMVKDDTKSAVAKAWDAALLEPEASVVALEQSRNATLRAAVVADYRDRFDAGLAANDWDTALRVAATAAALEPTASGWVGEAIAKHPRGLSAVPPEVLGRLPAATIAGLPPATIALPPASIAALPPAAIAALPPLRNSIGIELKLIPAGRFLMGQPGGDSNETPHQVTLTKPFYMGVYEVTNAQWKRVMGSVPSNWKDDDRPVEQVSWEDAVEFCRKLSALPDEQKSGRVYRLPTEAEWEYACRAGTTTKYSFGDDESKLSEYGWFDGNSGNETHPVGKKKPSARGLFDMHGNVWEWCGDSYGEYPNGAVTDPQGPSRASDRVRRGGSWILAARYCRSALRNGYVPSDRNSGLGFRLALSLSGAKPVPQEAGQ